MIIYVYHLERHHDNNGGKVSLMVIIKLEASVQEL